MRQMDGGKETYSTQGGLYGTLSEKSNRYRKVTLNVQKYTEAMRAHRSFNRIWKERDSAEPDLLGKILDRDNLNRAYKRVKANKGAPEVDGMTIEAALPWLKEHNQKLTGEYEGENIPSSPVRRVEIPKPDGGKRKLGIPTVIDRIIQQAMLQQLMPIYEPLFSDDSFGYRPGRGTKDAIYKIKEHIGQGYIRAVVLDLSRYFDTLNHTILLNLLRKQVKDESVIQMVKRSLKGGVMENGVVTETEEGSPQGGNLSPLFSKCVSEMNSIGSFTDGACHVFAMQMISYCWRRVNGRRKICWRAVRNIWKKH